VILVEGLFDLAQEPAANDASAAPHEGDAAHIQVPAILLGCGLQQHITLRVGDDLRAVERAAHIFNKCFTMVGDGADSRALEYL